MRVGKLKIMFLAATYYPLQDGVSIVTQYIAEGLAKKNDVLIVTSLEDGLERTEARNNVNIERIKVKRNPYSMRMVGERALLEKKIYEYNPDVLIAVSISTWTFDWLRGRLKRYPGKKMLYNHGYSLKQEYNVMELIKKLRIRRQIVADLLEIYQEWFWSRYQKTLIKYVADYDKVIYLDDKDELYLRMKSLNVNNDMFLGNAVDNVFFERKAYLSDAPKALAFINVSSYNENKNQEMALKAFYEAAIPDSRLVFVGSQETPYYKYLLDLNEKLKSEHENVGNTVQIYCGIPRKKVVELYNQSDVYILTSKHESWSLTLCEAAASGLALLSTNVGQGTCIPGVFLCKDEREFASNMKLISRNPKLRAERGRMAYDYAREYYCIEDKIIELEQQLLRMINKDE